MEESIIEVVNEFGYIGILFLMAIENIFPPIPSEIVLAFGGFSTTYTSLKKFGVILAATLGSLIGAIVLYYIGYLISAEKINTIINSKVGRTLRLKKENLKKAENWFKRHGYRAVFFARFAPIVRSIISVPAGTSKMNLGKFLLFTTAGTIVWNTVLVYAGSMLGSTWSKIIKYMDMYSLIIFILVPIVLIISSFLFYKNKNKI